MTAPLLLAFVLGASPSTVVGDVTLDGGNGPIRVRVEASSEQSPETPWRGFLERLIERYDRDGDGALNEAEGKDVFALPAASGDAISLDFPRADANQNGAIAIGELCDWYREAGFGPIVVRLLPNDPQRTAASEAVVQALERDGDAVFSSDELGLASGLLPRFDDDEDEILAVDELLRRTDAAAASSDSKPVSLAFQAPTGPADAIVEVGRTEAEASARLASPAGPIAENELALVGVELKLEPSDASTAAFASAKRFYLSQFAAKAKGTAGVPLRELDQDRTLRAIAHMAPFADRDADESLTAEELSAFLDLIEAGASCRTVVAVRDRGASLFDRFDLNADGALDFVELRRASQGKPIDLAALPRRYALRLTADSGAGSFGPVPLPEASSRAAKATEEESTGPRWFLSMDRSGDGVVTLSEFRGRPDRFASFDRDDDGRLDRTEAEQAGEP